MLGLIEFFVGKRDTVKRKKGEFAGFFVGREKSQAFTRDI
jgi:hypothetical protein